MGKSIGIVLVVFGMALLTWTGFNYTKKEKILDAGSIEISTQRQKTVSWPPYIGGIVLISGIVVLISVRKRAK
jgi:uncharacterized membrane protein